MQTRIAAQVLTYLISFSACADCGLVLNGNKNKDFQPNPGEMFASELLYDRRTSDLWAPAQYYLGLSYDKGEGVPKNNEQALAWYRKAAERGDASAQNTLGVMYEEGRAGLLQNFQTACNWFLISALQNNASAQRGIYRLNNSGKLINSDLVVALAWITLAASGESPHPSAAEERNDLSGRLTPEQVHEAQRLAREWKGRQPLGKSRLRPAPPVLTKIPAPQRQGER